MEHKNRNSNCLLLFLCFVLCCVFSKPPAYAMSDINTAGVRFEQEPNNMHWNATQTYDDYNNYGYIEAPNDEDWWKISFSQSGIVNFWLGNIPSNCDFDLRLYASDGTTLLAFSLSYGSANELITYEVYAYQTYYLRITTKLGSSFTNQYLFRAKCYPGQTLPVPLYAQETTSTCGCASGRMILAYYGISVTESEFKERARLNGNGDFTVVYGIKDTLNDFLEANNNTTRYRYTYINSYTADQLQDLVLRNILNNHPVQSLLRITSSDYFPYTSAGHYVVIKGMRYNSNLAFYDSIVNDPHYAYCAAYTVPISAMLTYAKAHSGGGYIINVDS